MPNGCEKASKEGKEVEGREDQSEGERGAVTFSARLLHDSLLWHCAYTLHYLV